MSLQKRIKLHHHPPAKLSTPLFGAQTSWQRRDHGVRSIVSECYLSMKPYEESVDLRKRSLDDWTLLNHAGNMKIHARHNKRLVQRVMNLLDLPTSLPASLVPTAVVPGPKLESSTTTATPRSSASRVPAQAAAKTTKASCSPSPTTSMAPSATWTACSYVGRDGKVNPDVRTLNGPGAINAVGQFILYACIASAADKTSKHALAAANAIDTFFLSSATGMHPNMRYGQVVRGPGPAGITGTFTGILDLRGLVKVLNGILILKTLGHASWTSQRESAMQSWTLQYSQWLADSDIGKKTGSRPNNHGTFYVSQVVAAKIYQGLNQDAIAILLQFFKREFADQIAASGEQPFEAIRTRPYHYRCFNLEALITNAKLGDQLGLDLWSSTSKYGATIQTAMDFIIASNPKGEKVDQAIPHVAAKNMKGYKSKPFWFYDQEKALSGSSARKAIKRDSTSTPKVPFTCPEVFENATSVEIDNGVFVTCDQLRPLYEAPFPEI
ncbi:alginate lyase-domain-containing protein [Coprinopsis sp. MPI-PUGE-AT-0042]|nr:alginate lyase-domain-containing protein [Coprinopsis sp. MPI-PUGE-AT-0042]